MKTMLIMTIAAIATVLSACGNADATDTKPPVTKVEKVIVGKPIGTFKELCPESHPLSQGWGNNKAGQHVHNCRALEVEGRALVSAPQDAVEAAE